MKQDDVQSLMMGLVMVALGYALYKHFKPGTTAPGAAPRPAQGPGGTSQSFAYGEPSPYTGSPFTALSDILSGTVIDVGSYGGRNYLNEISDPMLNGNGGRDSIRKPGGYW